MNFAGGEKGCWGVRLLAALVGQWQTSRVELQDGVRYKDTVKGMLVRLLLDNEESIIPHFYVNLYYTHPFGCQLKHINTIITKYKEVKLCISGISCNIGSGSDCNF